MHRLLYEVRVDPRIRDINLFLGDLQSLGRAWAKCEDCC